MVSEVNDKIVVHNGKKKVVSEESKESVKAALNIIQEKTNPVFFDKIDIHIMSDKKHLNIFNYYSAVVKGFPKSFSGMFIQGDTDVYINEKNILRYAEKRGLDFEEIIKDVIFHEIGHFFDEYYGCKINNYEEVLDLLDSGQLSVKKGKELFNKIINNDTFSDEEIFKEALIKDLSKLSLEELQELYTGNIYGQKKYDVKDYVNEIDSLRAEIFACIFAAILNDNSENSTFYLLKLRETYKVVSEFIYQMKNQEEAIVEKMDIVI